MLNEVRKKNIACLIMCRVGSSRLPGKALLDIKGKPVIQHVIDRAKKINSVNNIILYTTVNREDDILESIAISNGINFFRGPLTDVLMGFLGAVNKFNIDIFAVYTADDIFCDPELIDIGIAQIIETGCDFINLPSDLVCGGAAHCISRAALEKVCKIKNDNNTSFFSKFFMNDKFKIKDLKVSDPIFYNNLIRATLDYKEDLNFFKRVFEEFNTTTNNVSLMNIIKLINKKPEIAKINFFRQQDFIFNQLNQNKPNIYE